MNQSAEVIYGPPGTGKTSALINRASGAGLQGRVLFLAFTRAAANEVNDRTNASSAMTLHSFCYRQLGISTAQVVDRGKLHEFAKVVNIPISGGGINDMQAKEGDDYLAVVSYASNRIMPLPEGYDALGRPGSPQRFEYFTAAYEKWKNTYGYVDFDDMLFMWFESSMHPPQYDMVLLDEAQDLTRAQWAVFHKIIERTPRIVIAGDDDQAIFQWAGAIPEGMDDFGRKMDASREVLHRSHRVPALVKDMAEQVIQGVSRRVEKRYQSTRKTGEVKSWEGLAPLVSAVKGDQRQLWLFRDRFRMLEAQKELNHDMVPYQVAGGFSPWTDRNAVAAKAGKFDDIPSFKRDWYVSALESGAMGDPVELELSTVHKAKGREHDKVIFSVEGSGRALENMYEDPDAELRVLYVGLTRTSNRLWIHGSHPALSHA